VALTKGRELSLRSGSATPRHQNRCADRAGLSEHRQPREALEAEARRAGVAVADEQRFDESVRDFRSIIERAQRTHPDVYYIEALEPALDLPGQQLSDAAARAFESGRNPAV